MPLEVDFGHIMTAQGSGYQLLEEKKKYSSYAEGLQRLCLIYSLKNGSRYVEFFNNLELISHAYYCFRDRSFGHKPHKTTLDHDNLSQVFKNYRQILSKRDPPKYENLDIGTQTQQFSVLMEDILCKTQSRIAKSHLKGAF